MAICSSSCTVAALAALHVHVVQVAAHASAVAQLPLPATGAMRLDVACQAGCESEAKHAPGMQQISTIWANIGQAEPISRSTEPPPRPKTQNCKNPLSSLALTVTQEIRSTPTLWYNTPGSRNCSRLHTMPLRCVSQNPLLSAPLRPPRETPADGLAFCLKALTNFNTQWQGV